MTDDDIRALREALADGPTPGPWWLDHDLAHLKNHVAVSAEAHGAFAEVVWVTTDDQDAGENSPFCEATARYIAAASPDRIARLLDEVEGLRAENDLLRTENDEALEVLQTIVNEWISAARALIAKRGKK